jgi:hypothetical protein
MSRISTLLGQLAAILLFSSTVIAEDRRTDPGNLLRDPGFESVQEPDQYGNPFTDWGGWKWEGNGERRADARVKHTGKISGLLVGKGVCKIAFQQNVSVEPGWYRLSGFVRAIGLKRGTWDRTAVFAFEPPVARSIDSALPEGSYGWRRFERKVRFDRAYPKVGFYVYLFGPGLVWLDDLVFERVATPADTSEELILSDPEEKLAEEPNGEPCPMCGLKISPQAKTCPHCGEPTAGLADRTKALEAVQRLESLLERARREGIETAYQEIVPIVARMGLVERWNLPEQGGHRAEYVTWAIDACARATREIELIRSGKREPLAFVPLPNPRALRLEDGYLRAGRDPMLLLAMNGDATPAALQKHLFGPVPAGFCSAVGGTRYDYKSQPIWKAFQQDPDTHRVGWRGWCGHIIRDRWSIGGNEGDVMICLESPRTRQAVVEYLRKTVPALKKEGIAKYYDMDFEFAYVCFCDRSRAMFRVWLRHRYHDIMAVNRAWGTTYASFNGVPLPGDDQAKAATDRDIEQIANRALWYDFARFNAERFTDYMTWARSEIRKLDPQAQVMTGAPFYMLSANAGWTGIDTELLNERVNDVVLNECHASTVTTDLLNSIAGGTKLHQDREYHGDIAHVLPQFLHGMSYLNMWHWPSSPTYSPRSFYLTDVGHSPEIPLSDVALVLRDALDVRRLGTEIVRFHHQSSPLAILYSMDSLLQVDPRLRLARDCPHSSALKAVYEGCVYNDLPVGFTTERKIAAGDLSRFKVLILPAVAYTNQQTQAAIEAWTRAGGALVVTPSSWLGDEHAKPADYLSRIGVTIRGVRRANGQVRAARPDVERDTGFIMGPMTEEDVKAIPVRRLEIADAGLARRVEVLEGHGVEQVIEIDEKATVLARFDGRQPALVRLPLGQGRVYYLCTPLTEPSYHRFFDWLLDAEQVARPVKVVDQRGKKPFLIDSRSVSNDRGWLTYAVNLGTEPVDIELRPGPAVSRITDLIRMERLSGRQFRLGPHERAIFRLDP